MGKALAGISPFFIVGDAQRSVDFYRDKLGFEATYRQDDFAVLRRDAAQLFVKAIGGDRGWRQFLNCPRRLGYVRPDSADVL